MHAQTHAKHTENLQKISLAPAWRSSPRVLSALSSARVHSALPRALSLNSVRHKGTKKNPKQEPEDAVGDCHARGLPLCKCVQTDATHTLTLSLYDSCSATPALLSLTFTSAPPSQPHFRPSTPGKTRVSSTSISTQVGALHHHQAHIQEHSINQSLNACSADPGAIVEVAQQRAALAVSSTSTPLHPKPQPK